MNLRRGICDSATVTDLYDLSNKVICLSGTISGFTRTKAKNKLIDKYPRITFSDNISKRVEVLVVGHGVGQIKLKKAEQYGIPVIEASKVL